MPGMCEGAAGSQKLELGRTQRPRFCLALIERVIELFHELAGRLVRHTPQRGDGGAAIPLRAKLG